MAEMDILSHLIEENPNGPATNGVLLLMRQDYKYEFKTLRKEMNQRFDFMYDRMDKIEGRMDKLESRIENLEQQMSQVIKSLDFIAQKVSKL